MDVRSFYVILLEKLCNNKNTEYVERYKYEGRINHI